MIVGGQKPPLGELRHHGVKGMKWGVRNNKPTSSDIHNARIRQDLLIRDHNSSIDQLNRVSENGTAAQKKAAVKKFQKTQRDFLTSEDRITASRMTTGEKVVTTLLTGPVGLVVMGANHVIVKGITKSVDRNRRRAA
jgi:hypothetical protein